MRILKNKNGMALITVMIIFLVLTTLLGALTVLSNTNLNQSIRTKEHTTAYYTAEAGLTKVVGEFEAYIQTLSEQSPTPSVSAFGTAVDSYVIDHAYQQVVLSENNGEIPYADVTMTYSGIVNETYRSYLITSIGHLGDASRTLMTNYMFEYKLSGEGNGFVIDKAVLVKTTLQLTGSSKVIGAPISSYQTTAGAILLDWSTTVPGVELDPSLFSDQGDLEYTAIFNNLSNIDAKITEGGLDAVTPLDEVHEFPPIIMPTYPAKETLARLPEYSITIPNGGSYQLIQADGSLIQSSWSIDGSVYTIPSASSWYYVPQFIISGGDDFTIDVGSTNKYLVVDKLQLNKQVSIVGSGTLTIYVTGNTPETATSADSTRVQLGYTNDTPIGAIGHPERFVVYVNELYYRNKKQTLPVTITIGGDSKYHMSLMGANFNFTTSGSAAIEGYVVTGGTSVLITGAAGITTTLYYAPNARVTVSGSGYVNGAILSDSFIGSGDISINYSDVAFENFPFAVLDPITGGSGASIPILTISRGMTIEQ